MRIADSLFCGSALNCLRATGASLCLALCLVSGAASGLGIEFWHIRLCRARAVLRIEKVPGATEAYAEIHTRAEPAQALPGLIVVDAAGTKVPFKVVAAGPGDRLVVAFRMTQLLNYYVYFNPVADSPAEPFSGRRWEPRSGVLLRTYRWGLDRADLNTLDGFRALVHASKVPYGGGYREAIFQGPNPFGPSERYVSVFTAYLRIERPGWYGFATNSDDASALYMDGKVVAHYLGRHGAAATYGQRNGAVELRAGVHRLDYLHAEDTGWQACVAGWKKPGDKYFSLIPAEAFVPIVGARVLRYEKKSGAVPDFRSRVKRVYADAAGTMVLIGVAFDALPTGVLEPQAYRWSFGDDETAAGKTVEHAYLTQGTFPVTLEILDKRGPRRAVRHWVGVWHLEEQNTAEPEKTRAAFEEILAGYSLRKQPTAALETLCAFYKPNPAMDSRRMRVCQELVKRLKGTDLPRALEYSFELAELYGKLGGRRTILARKTIYRSILELAGSDALKARAHLRLGEVFLFYERNPTGALEHFRRVGELTSPEQVGRLAMIRIGDAQLELGKLEAAREAYRAVPVSAADRRNATVLSEAYGLSVERSLAEGNCADALETINTWEWRFPEVKLAGYSALLRVWVALKQGRTDEAKKHCRLIVEKLEEDAYKPEAYAVLIRLLLKERDWERAAKRYSELRESFPLAHEARELAPLFNR